VTIWIGLREEVVLNESISPGWEGIFLCVSPLAPPLFSCEWHHYEESKAPALDAALATFTGHFHESADQRQFIRMFLYPSEDWLPQHVRILDCLHFCKSPG